MLPNGVAVSSMLTTAQDVVTAFGALIAVVVGLAFGMIVVKKVPAWIKRSAKG
jgi:hypothetical protein